MGTHRATANWNGGLKDGSGGMQLGEGEVSCGFSFKTRFEGEKGTNPEELIGAALAGCFSMALSARLEKAGHPPQNIQTTAEVTLEKKDGDYRITAIVLDTTGAVPGVSEEEFQENAEEAKNACPVSKALKGVDEITLKARME